jgi:hypothetical protein
MTRQSEDICAQCKSLTGKGHREQWAEGKGRCTGYDDSSTPLRDPILAWNTRACIWFERDRDPARRAAREKWIEEQKAKAEGATCKEQE